jgi:CheY-like chemotaxis protein
MSKSLNGPFRVLIADDDIDDIQLTRDCFLENSLPIDVKEVADGQFLLDHLMEIATIKDPRKLPQLILLDLNMPRKSGFEALKELKEIEALRRIPVIVFSTSKASKDIEKAYELGASCFVSKPNTFEEWCDKMGKLGKFWIECVRVAV